MKHRLNSKKEVYYSRCINQQPPPKVVALALVNTLGKMGGIKLSNYQAIYTDLLMKEIKATPDEYLPSLLDIMRIFRESITLKSADESFKEGWHEAMTGETIPIDKLWTGIDAE